MTGQDVDVVKALYAIVCNGDIDDGERAARVVAELEGMTGKPFRNTAEFHYRVADCLKRMSCGKTIGHMTKAKRRAAKWTQADLAAHLGVTKRTVINYESNETPPTKRLLEWLSLDGVHMGKSETGGIDGQIPENGGFSYGEK